ncbi:MAG: ribosome maturation factor RimM [Gammaproteobacteria bacterium]
MPGDAGTDSDEQDEMLVMGRVAGPFGVKGWVRITAFTELSDGLLDYTPWYFGHDGDWREAEVLDARPHGKGMVALLADCTDRDAAMALTGTEIGVWRSQLPAAGENEYYWNDLIGLQVMTKQGRVLGTVDHLIETGANDVLVVRGEREVLVPFVLGEVVEAVDLEQRVIRVDWDPDY